MVMERIFRILFTWSPLADYVVRHFGPQALTRVFWTLLAVEEAAAIILMLVVLAQGSRGWGPEGPVGAWLIFVPPILLLIPAAVVLIWNSDSVKMGGIFCLGVPLLQITFGAIYGLLSKA
jgi:hypothetical protein